MDTAEFKMYYLYVLKSTIVPRHYIGITDGLDKRLKKHNSASVRSTKAYRPWRLVYGELLPDKTSARKREILLKKNSKVREGLLKKIDDGLIV